MWCHHHKFIFIPLLVIIVGAVALLTNLGVLDVSVWNWWPVLIVILGVYMFVWHKRKKHLLKGLLLCGGIRKKKKNAKIEKLLGNEKVREELGKIEEIVEGVISEQIDKLHAKYTEKKESPETEEEI